MNTGIKKKLNTLFNRIAFKSIHIIGSSTSFIICVLLIIVWAVFGPITHYSDTWQLIANTVSTLITTIIVILIQAAQNRDSKALHLKIDELIKAVDKANDRMAGIEELSEAELEALKTKRL